MKKKKWYIKSKKIDKIEEKLFIESILKYF